MLAATDALTAIFGSLGGFAAIVVAVNTWLMRKEAKKLREQELAGANRMDTFETSQASLRAALDRADTENERLRGIVSDQEVEIGQLKVRVGDLEDEVRELRRGI